MRLICGFVKREKEGDLKIEREYGKERESGRGRERLRGGQRVIGAPSLELCREEHRGKGRGERENEGDRR